MSQTKPIQQSTYLVSRGRTSPLDKSTTEETLFLQLYPTRFMNEGTASGEVSLARRESESEQIICVKFISQTTYPEDTSDPQGELMTCRFFCGKRADYIMCNNDFNDILATF